MNLLAITFTIFSSAFLSLVFYTVLNHCMDWFQNHHHMLLFLPFIGLLIVFLNQNQYRIKSKLIIVVTTWASHLFGASMGRELTIISIGKNIGQKVATSMRSKNLSSWLPGFGAVSAFSCTLGQPLSSIAFVTEENLIPKRNLLYFPLLIICSFLISFFGSLFIRDRLQFNSFLFNLDFNFSSVVAQFVLAAVILVLSKTTEFAQRKNLFPYFKMLFLALLYVVLVYSFQLYDYCNLSVDLIRQAFSDAYWLKNQLAFSSLIKYFLSTLCLAAGFAGGEFTINLVIGCLIGVNLYPLIQNWTTITSYEFFALAMIYYMSFKMRKPVTGLLLCFEFFNFSFAIGSLPLFILCFLFRRSEQEE